MRLVVLLIQRIFIISMLEIVNISVNSCDQKKSNVQENRPQGYFTKSGIEEYELIHPKKVSDKGEFISNYLPHFHEDDTLEKINRGELHPEAATLHYHLPINGKNVQVKLKPNPKAFPSSMVIERRDKESAFDIGKVKLKKPEMRNCHYNGEIIDEPGSKVALSTCNGLAGFIKSKSGDYLIEPVHSYNPRYQDHPHMLFKKRENNKLMDGNCMVSKGKYKKNSIRKEEKGKENISKQDKSSKLKTAYKNSKMFLHNDKSNFKISNIINKKNLPEINEEFQENNLVAFESTMSDIHRNLTQTIMDVTTATMEGSMNANEAMNSENLTTTTTTTTTNNNNNNNNNNNYPNKNEGLDNRDMVTIIADQQQNFKTPDLNSKNTINSYKIKGRSDNSEYLYDGLDIKKKPNGELTRAFKNDTGATRKAIEFEYSYTSLEPSTQMSIQLATESKKTKLKSEISDFFEVERNSSGEKKNYYIKQPKETNDDLLDDDNYLTELSSTESLLKNDENYSNKKSKSNYSNKRNKGNNIDKTIRRLKSENNSTDWDNVVKDIKQKDKADNGKLMNKEKLNKNMKSKIYNRNLKHFQKTDGIKNTRPISDKEKIRPIRGDPDKNNYNDFIATKGRDFNMEKIKYKYSSNDGNEFSNKKKENQFSENFQFIDNDNDTPQDENEYFNMESSQICDENLITNLTDGNKFKRAVPIRAKGCKPKPKAECKLRGLDQSWDIRLLVVVSYHFSQRHRDIDLESFILTVINMVSTNFYDASLGILLDVKLVRMVFIEFRMEELDEEKLGIEHLFENFCLFQHRINPVKVEHPFHHEIGIYIIKMNQCGGNTIMGVTNKASVCKSKDACIISVDEGLLLGNIITHQIGHSLGASHDDGGQGSCQPSEPDGSVYYHMNPIISMNSTEWSRCSSQGIQRFIRNQGAKCLEHVTPDLDFDWPNILPGQIYDPVQQCDLNFHLKTLPCVTGDFCKFLYCQANKKQCVSLMVPPADGTLCAIGMWCIRGTCVTKGRHPGMVNGEWSSWSVWTSCSRTCGVGIQHAYRLCNNPSPALGGRYCVGSRTRHQTCNFEVNCDRYALSFRDHQCKMTDHTPFRNVFYTWRAFHNMFEYVDCALICETRSGIVAVRNLVAEDGTPCKPGTQNVCVEGKCMEVGCDWGINSGAVRDACGECHGNGSHCRIIQGLFDEKYGKGYVPFLKVPKGSGMIYAREINPSDIILVVTSYNTESFYLNGPLESVEPRPAEYDFGNTRGVYSIRGNMERVFIAGPTQEDLVFYIKYGKDPNPGIRYQFALPERDKNYIPVYSWQFLDWDLCSDACGGGQQKARARCVEDTGGVVDIKYCIERERPQDIIRSCNEFPCYPKWWVGAWSECVNVANESVRYRTVLCMRTRDPNSLRNEILKDRYCCDEEKPALVRRCNETVDEIPLEKCSKEEVLPGIINIQELESEFNDLDPAGNIINKRSAQRGGGEVGGYGGVETAAQHQNKAKLGSNITKHPEEAKLMNRNETVLKANVQQPMRRKEGNLRPEALGNKRWHGKARFHQQQTFKEGNKDNKLVQNLNVHILNQEKKSSEKNGTDKGRRVFAVNNTAAEEGSAGYNAPQKSVGKGDNKVDNVPPIVAASGEIKFGGTTCTPPSSSFSKKPKPLHLPPGTTCTPKCTTCPVVIKFTYPPKDLQAAHAICPIIDQLTVPEFTIAIIPIVCQIKCDSSPSETYLEVFHQTASWPYGQANLKTVIKGQRALYFLTEMRDNASLHPFVFHAEN